MSWYCKITGAGVKTPYYECKQCGTKVSEEDLNEAACPKCHPQKPLMQKCPVCKKGRIIKKKISGLLGLRNTINIVCNNCNAKFIEGSEKEEERTFRLDLSNSSQSSKYDGQIMKVSEWERGYSDLEWCIKNDKLPRADISSLSIVVNDGEITHWYSSAQLLEERAVRSTYGGAVRLMKGVYVGKSVGESYGELRKIDSGNLLLTNQRLVFNGNMRNVEYKLGKVLSVQEYNDAIEIASSSRQKVQIFVVDEPHKWATFINMAIKKLDSNKNGSSRKDKTTAHELEKWYALMKNGAITKAEFESKKKKLLEIN